MGPSLLSEQGGCLGLAGKSKETTSVLSERVCSPPALRHQLSMRTPLQCQFPANREKNREFRRIGPFGAILKADKFVNSETCIKIP
jgi:hypothetical protein